MTNAGVFISTKISTRNRITLNFPKKLCDSWLIACPNIKFFLTTSRFILLRFKSDIEIERTFFIVRHLIIFIKGNPKLCLVTYGCKKQNFQQESNNIQ